MEQCVRVRKQDKNKISSNDNKALMNGIKSINEIQPYDHCEDCSLPGVALSTWGFIHSVLMDAVC